MASSSEIRRRFWGTGGWGGTQWKQRSSIQSPLPLCTGLKCSSSRLLPLTTQPPAGTSVWRKGVLGGRGRIHPLLSIRLVALVRIVHDCGPCQPLNLQIGSDFAGPHRWHGGSDTEHCSTPSQSRILVLRRRGSVNPRALQSWTVCSEKSCSAWGVGLIVSCEITRRNVLEP
jgi:hypothetical protein